MKCADARRSVEIVSPSASPASSRSKISRPRSARSIAKRRIAVTARSIDSGSCSRPYANATRRLSVSSDSRSTTSGRRSSASPSSLSTASAQYHSPCRSRAPSPSPACSSRAGGVLADRLQHPVAAGGGGLARAQEALREQRVQEREVGVCDGGGGLGGRAAGEDGEGAEGALLLGDEQVVAPGDGGEQGVVAGVVLAAAGQELEVAVEGAQELCRGVEVGSRGRQLERERERVEALAERGHVLVGGVEGGVGEARALAEELDPLGLGERGDGVELLLLQVEALARGDEQGGAGGDVAEQGELVGECGQQVLGVVEDEQELPAREGARRGCRAGASPAARRRRVRARSPGGRARARARGRARRSGRRRRRRRRTRRRRAGRGGSCPCPRAR